MNIVELKKNEYKSSVSETLRDALDADFESVVVIGFCKDNTFRVTHSKLESRLMMLGVLAEAQHQILDGGYA